MHLQEQSEQQVADAVSALVKKGFSVYQVEEEKRSLEDIFLEMTTKGSFGKMPIFQNE